MNWFISAVSSSVGKKIMMALTGLFLCSFLVVHLIGNLQLLKLDLGLSFNTYAQFMSHNPVIQTISKGNFAIILAHALIALFLTRQNASARPIGYQVKKGSANSTWSSRNMGLLGTILLVFIAVHLYHFWWQVHYGGTIPMREYTDDHGNLVSFTDLYAAVMFAFSNPYIVAFYVFSMIAMGYHLYHGFASAFQSLGLNHVKYNGLIRAVGFLFYFVIPAAYASIPLIIFFR
ncbi:MAG: succinate dehydrogenase [Chitinophagaceae bacterium]|nr:succinate dehydrogenase [Chitinophagaceae bacterium]